MNRDYTIVWLGIVRQVADPEELDEIGDRSHPLIRAALSHGLGYYCDSFDNEDADAASYFLLIGRNLAALGLKEGRLAFEVQVEVLASEATRVGTILRDAGIDGPSALHVFYHVDR